MLFSLDGQEYIFTIFLLSAHNQTLCNQCMISNSWKLMKKFLNNEIKIYIFIIKLKKLFEKKFLRKYSKISFTLCTLTFHCSINNYTADESLKDIEACRQHYNGVRYDTKATQGLLTAYNYKMLKFHKELLLTAEIILFHQSS